MRVSAQWYAEGERTRVGYLKSRFKLCDVRMEQATPYSSLFRSHSLSLSLSYTDSLPPLSLDLPKVTQVNWAVELNWKRSWKFHKVKILVS